MALEFRYGAVAAWDTEGTRRRLRQAATEEFAEHGLDGTTMTGIAEKAGINKERLYTYFGDKRALWEIVLAEELEQLAVAVGSQDVGLDDVGEFAGATFDNYAAHPQLARLLQWEGRGPAADAKRRAAHYRDKVDRFVGAQRDGRLDDGLDAAHLVFALIALSAWWQTVPQLAEMITGAGPDDVAERARRRAFVVEAARRLTTPRWESRDHGELEGHQAADVSYRTGALGSAAPSSRPGCPSPAPSSRCGS